MCMESSETLDHLFQTCFFAHRILSFIVALFNWVVALHNTMQILFFPILVGRPFKKEKDLLRLYIYLGLLLIVD